MWGVFLHLLKKCFFVCYSPVVIMNASPVGFPSSVISGLAPGVAAIKIGLLDVWKTPYMETFLIGFIYSVSWRVKLWECLLALLNSKEDPTAAPRCVPNRSWILRQQLVNQPLKLLLGKDSEMGILACSLCTEP